MTLVGKGVCFDTGGLDLKPSSSMLIMKKDMGGAANVLALAQMVMDARLRLRLRVLIPAVENAVAGNAFRPLDVFRSRKGLTVEIGNTDAEGRLVLADALALACEEKPDLLIDMGTLTGAARVALGPDLPPFYTNDETLAQDVARFADRENDPLWRLPLWPAYDAWLDFKGRRSQQRAVGRLSPARSPARCFCSALSRTPKAGCMSISMAGPRRRSRHGRKAANARPRARSINCLGNAMDDPRLTPARPDLAAQYLEGQDQGGPLRRWSKNSRSSTAIAPLRAEPSSGAMLLTQALRGERVTIYDRNGEGWAWGQLNGDGYVGWLPERALAEPAAAPTHKITAIRTFAFPGPSIKLPPVDTLPMGAKIAVVREDGPFAVTRDGWHLPLPHLAGLDRYQRDFVAVAEQFVGTPYLWGGKSSLGIDCSGLVQIALNAAGTGCPRDSDMQQDSLGRALDPAQARKLQRGDLIFWQGHVAIARDAATLVHANAHHMATTIETTRDAIARIGAAGGEITAIKRLA